MRYLGLTLLGLLVVHSLSAQSPMEDTDQSYTAGRLTLMLNFEGHTSTIGNVKFGIAGRRLYTGSHDQTFHIWNLANDRLFRVLYGPGMCRFHQFAPSADFAKIAVPARYPIGKTEKGDTIYEDVIYIFKLPDGEIEKVLRGHTDLINALTFSPDGKTLLSCGNDHGIRFWDVSTGKLTQTIDTKIGVEALAISPSGVNLFQLTKGRALMRDMKSGTVIGSFRGGELDDRGQSLRNIAWSLDGKTLATGTNDGCRLWESIPDKEGKGVLRHHLLPKQLMRSVSFSKHSDSILVTWSHTYKAAIFDVKTGVKKSEIQRKDEGGFVRAGALSPDGTMAATSGGIHGSHHVLLWNASNGKVEKQYGTRSWLSTDDIQAGWSPDGKTVAWKAADPKRTTVTEPRAFRLADLTFVAGDKKFTGPITEQGALSLSGSKANEVKILKGGAVLSTLKESSRLTTEDGPMTLIGTNRAAVTRNWTTTIHNINNGRLLHTLHHTGVVRSIAPSPDGQYLMTIANDQKLRVWSIKDGELLLSLFVKDKDWIAWTPEGYYAASPGGEQLIGWKVDNGIDKLPSYYSAEHFRKQLRRPDVIQLVLEKGSVSGALDAANAARTKAGVAVAPVLKSPEKLLPPGVVWAVDKSKLPVVTVTLTATESVPEQPIKSIRLLVDNRPLADKASYIEFAKGQEKKQFEIKGNTWQFTLEPGVHDLSVLARSVDDTPSMSNRIEVTCPAALKNRPTLHHVGIGINKYKEAKLDLGAAQPDAVLLSQTLQTVTNRGLLFQRVNSKPVYDKEATQANVLATIDAIRETPVKPDDLFIFSFAGHSVRKNGEFFLLTHEADPTDFQTLTKSAISGAVLAEKLAEFPCQVLVLLDSCYSGAFAGAKLKSGSEDALGTLASLNVRVTVLCAAHDHEEALAINGKGLFTGAVVRSLTKAPGAFFNPNGEVNVLHLMAYVHQAVTQESESKQTPCFRIPPAQPALILVK